MSEERCLPGVGEEKKKRRRRRDDQPVTVGEFRRALRKVFIALICLFIVQVPVAIGTYYLRDQNAERISDIQASNRTGRDQICTVFERDHLRSVRQLRQTYPFVVKVIQREETHTSLGQAVIAQLTRTEEEGRTDSAPRFCDAPGAAAERRGAKPVGLPEPDPWIPCRPKALAVLDLPPPEPRGVPCREQ